MGNKLTDAQIQANKLEFINLLMSTGRENIDKLINWLENSSDFFTAPSSTIYHGDYDGGLCQHSLNVYKAIKAFIKNGKDLPVKENAVEEIPEDVLIISTLLHDVCKANFYVPEIKFTKDDATGAWKKYKSYKCVDSFPVGHGEKSVIMLQNFIRLKTQEILAIRWHMSFFDPGSFISPYEKPAQLAAADACPLVTLLQIADYYASHLMEYAIDQKVENVVY